MKKVFYWISTVLQVLFLIIAFVIQFYSMRKMGMMRYVVYMNRTWEEQYPIALLQNIAIAVFVLFLVITYIVYVKMKKENSALGKKALQMIIMQAIITTIFVFFTLAYSSESYRSYYFTSLILAVTALIQDIKLLVYLKR